MREQASLLKYLAPDQRDRLVLSAWASIPRIRGSFLRVTGERSGRLKRVRRGER